MVMTQLSTDTAIPHLGVLQRLVHRLPDFPGRSKRERVDVSLACTQ